MFDLHMHTIYCDGADSPEEMVLAAIEKGLDTVGISGHSYTWFDESYCMSLSGTESYINEVNRLKESCEDKIRVLLGIERDYYAEIDNDPFDYVIGSCHYIYADGEYFDVDSDIGTLMSGVNNHLGGDVMAAAEKYYEQAGSVIEKTDCDIIGHFDLITKFNEHSALVDTGHPRYIAAWQRAVDRLFETAASRFSSGRINRLETLGLITAEDKPVFEINTGAIAKGCRTAPYPAKNQIEYIKSRGGILILSSDSHRSDNICFDFDDYLVYLHEIVDIKERIC